MYCTRNIMVTDSDLFEWCDTVAHKANNLYNAALFRIRQVFTGWGKADLNDNQKEVFSELEVMIRKAWGSFWRMKSRRRTAS